MLTINSAISIIREGKGDDRRTVVREDPTNSGDRRRVALDEDTVALLEPLRRSGSSTRLGCISDTEEAPRPDRVGCRWHRCRDLAGSKEEWRLHDMRPLVGDVRVGSGYDLATVAGRLGHSDPSTSLRVCAHARGQRDVKLAASLGAIFRE